MLVEGRKFSRTLGAPQAWDETVFRFCQFQDLDIDGVSFGGLMAYCTLERSQFYWGLFNTATFVKVRFVDCVFPGTSFRGCHLVRCEFENCRFSLDNLGGSATIDDCTFTECRLEGCTFVAAPRDTCSPMQPNTRLYGCSITGCTGLDAA